MNIAASMPVSGLQVRAAVSAGLVALALGASGAVIAARPVAHQASAPAVSAPAAGTSTTTGTDSTTGTTSTRTQNGTSTAFGQQVKQQVATCKAAAATAGTHGIGACVSGWVTTHNPGHTKGGSGTTGSGTTSGTGTGG